MDHVHDQSRQHSEDKRKPEDECHEVSESGSYYYDDSTNYQIYRDDDEEEVAEDQTGTDDT